MAAACSGDADPAPILVSPDGAIVPGRTVSDADLRGIVDGAADSPDAPDNGDASMDLSGDSAGDASDAGDGGDAQPGLKIEITINTPMAGGVAPALTKFTPAVEVMVDSPSGAASDTLKDVNADVIDRASMKVVANGKLNQIGFRSMPETSAVTYSFADSPIDISMLPSGNYYLTVTASTAGGTQQKVTQDFQIDAGPTIRINAPVKDKAYKGSAPVDLAISDDYFGPISNVSVKVGQKDVMVAGPGGPSGTQYTATLDFASFSPPLEGEQILTVRAKNKNGTETVSILKFVSDSVGPTFKNATPKDGQLIGNVIPISVEVDDPAGVLASSVIAVFANGAGTEYKIALNPPVAGDPSPAYTAVFDTRILPFGENALFPTLSFRASDNLGNEALVTNVLSLDNRPPLADLDPPDMRIWAKTDSGLFGCSWPFDPVGGDAADDADIVPQIATIRARVEDQGNDPLSGSSNYVPIATVNSAQLLILSNLAQPLIVNTNPKDPVKMTGDDYCDAINPLLVPTTTPMTKNDAMLVTLTPVPIAGSPDLTNGIDASDQSLKVGDERSANGQDAACRGSANAKSPDPVCDVSRSYTKARWGYYPGFGWLPHNDAMTMFLNYSFNKIASIWTIPAQVAGETNPLCGGTQFDSLANFVSDGWACMAVLASDNLGNKQVSRPFRLCVDKDGDGSACPHKAIASVDASTPIVVHTTAPHGLATGDQAHVSGITMIAMVNGNWTVTKIDDTTFSLDGSKVPTGAAVSGWTRPTVSNNGFTAGYVVRMQDVPNCTGTVTAATPKVVVDSTQTCKPWRTYPVGEMRTY